MSGFLPSVFLFLTLCTGLIPCRAAGKEAGPGPRPPILDARYAPARPDLPEDQLSSDRILDVFFPSCPPPRGGYPVVVFIHGGGFKNGDKSTSGSIGPIRDSLLSHGFVFVSANYYLTLHFHDKGVSCGSEMRNGFPESGAFDPSIQRAIDDASEDICLALKYLRSRRRELHLDMDRVALCGGSAGAITDKLHLRDVVAGMSAYTNSNFGRQFKFDGNLAPCCSFDLLSRAIAAGKALGVSVVPGPVYSNDLFYEQGPGEASSAPLARLGVLCVEMEAAALYLNAAAAGKNALALLTISDNLVTGEALPALDRQNTFTQMMEIALEIA